MQLMIVWVMGANDIDGAPDKLLAAVAALAVSAGGDWNECGKGGDK
jgi:hypothetical protein